MVIPVIHKVIEVSLETMRLDVKREAREALITEDYLRGNLQAEFYIKVQPEDNDIVSAARSLGDRSVDPVTIKELVFEKLVSALRTVAAKSTLFALNSEREKFADDVKKAVSEDLKHNGLTLETVTVSQLDQADIKDFDESNVFDAQGRKRVAEITQAARVVTNTLERDAERDIKEKDVETRKKVLTLELDQKRAEAEQGRDVEMANSEAKRKADEFDLEQLEIVAKREIGKDRAVELENVDKARKVEVAERDKEAAIIDAEKKKELADKAREQAVLVAEVARDKAQALADREKEIEIAAKEEERAKAESARLAAEAVREANEQAVKTVEVVEAAKRDKEQQVIAAQADAEKNYVTQQRKADASAYEVKKDAEARKEAAEADYAAKVKAAEAEKEQLTKAAAGQKAKDMVPVEVGAKQVEVDRADQMIVVDVAAKQVEVDQAAVAVKDAEVAVERKALQQKEEFGRAGIDLQIKLAQIEAMKEVEIAKAAALGTMLSNAEMTLFGDPNSAADIVGKYNSAMGIGKSLEGFMASMPEGSAARKLVDGVIEKVGDLAEAGAARLTPDKDKNPTPATDDASTSPPAPAPKAPAPPVAPEKK